MAQYQPPVEGPITKKGIICAHCGGEIPKGEKAIYYPQSKQTYCVGKHVNQPKAGTPEYVQWRIESHLSSIATSLKRLAKNGGNKSEPPEHMKSTDGSSDVSDDDVPF